MTRQRARGNDAPDRATSVRWHVRLGVAVIRLLALTWRIRRTGHDVVTALRRARRPIVFTAWHGQMLPLLWSHRGEGVSVLISEHRDGEIIAGIASVLGFRAVRGSTYRGADRALAGLVRELREGHDIAVTPDGPRGPAGHFAPGALIAAQRANGTVVSVGAAATRAWRMKSWDGFMIPKPFARVTIVYDTAPIEGTTAREAAAEAPRFQRLLESTTERAARG